MICNVFGKALTDSTLLILPEYKNSRVEMGREELAKLALASKNLQGKGKEEAEAVRYVESLRDRWPEKHLTLGWIYNATGAAITLVDSSHWEGSLALSNPYPVQVENGQWGLFAFDHEDSQSSGAVVYEGFNSYSNTACYWCVAWKVGFYTAQVLVKIEKDFKINAEKWKSVHKEVRQSGTVHKTKQDGLLSVISTSPGPRAVFEAVLALDKSCFRSSSRPGHCHVMGDII